MANAAYCALALVLLTGTALLATNCGTGDLPEQAHARSAATALSETFDGVAAGELPGGWRAETAGGTVGVDDLPDAVDKSLRIANPKGEASAQATRVLDTPLTGVVHVEARVRAGEATGHADVLAISDSGNGALAGIAVRDGFFVNAGSGEKVIPATAARWYALRVVVRVHSYRFDLFIDGVKVLTDVPFHTPAGNVGKVSFGIGAGHSGILHIDTVSVRREPDPTVSYLAMDTFDQGTVGAVPEGYELATSGGTATISALPSPEDKSLQLTKTSPGGEAKAVRGFARQTETVIVQATVRTNETSGVKAAFYVQSSEGKTAASIQFNGSTLSYLEGSASHPLVERVHPGEWYTIRLVLDPQAKQFVIYVDGKRFPPVGRTERPARLNFRDPTATDISRVLFNIGEGQTGTLLADKVLAYRNPTSGPTGEVVDVRAYGAKGDGVTDDTAAIQAAIAAVPSGGSVYLAGGVFLTGMIELKSHMTLYINHDATLLGSQEDSHYPDLRLRQDRPPALGGNIARALIFSHRANHVVIEGGGVIHGNGDKAAWVWSAGNTPHESTRPVGLFLTQGTDITIRHVHVKEAAAWAVVPAEIERLTIADVDIDSTVTGHRDGIDVVDSHDVLLERVNVLSDDDAICFKSHNQAAPGSGSRGVDGAVVRLLTVGGSLRANGIKFGTASSGAFRNVVVEDVLIKNTNNAAIAIANVDGAVVSNIAFRRVTIVSTKRALFVLIGRRIWTDDLGTRHSADPKWVGALRFEDITGTRISDELPRGHLGIGAVLSGSVEPAATYKIYDVLLSNVRLTLADGGTGKPAEPREYSGNYPEATYWPALPAYGFFFRHVDGLTVRNSVTLVPNANGRPETATRDVKDYQAS